MSEYRCPRCQRQDGLWQAVDVPGWRAVDAHLAPMSPQGIDWYAATPNGGFGCGECEWEGLKSDLERLGTDGEPLPAIHPRQLRIDAA